MLATSGSNLYILCYGCVDNSGDSMSNEWICKKCKCPIVVGMRYAMNESGDLLCEECFTEMVKNG